MTALITGASSGIGQAISKKFDQSGISTVLLGRNLERLKKTQSSLKHCLQIVAIDQTGPFADLKTTLDSNLKNIEISVLVNNAGIYIPKSIDEDEDSVWNSHFESNLMSAVKLVRYFWPKFKKQNKGHIINISSTLALRPIAHAAAYSSLKSAMNSWTQSLALEGAKHNIRANAVCPGVVDTPIHGFHGKTDSATLALKDKLRFLQPLEKLATPDDIAGIVLALSSENCDWLTGTLLPADGGIMLTGKEI